MSLYSDLQKVSSEEDVKDLYIKALKLKGYQKNLKYTHTAFCYEKKQEQKCITLPLLQPIRPTKIKCQTYNYMLARATRYQTIVSQQC